ncbi:hypothetical protein LGH70_00850 [Hymenobacter sp. BT635]|uniref:YD repeat-containing protein n=1 Tax=Hymenobacter nitidus TaxID=2880929 RepID=A0ABS8A6U6_9BACT|nr:hypothetical protein [Hymenobacter nitidus]MCB2376112.1 hypothetical protein [Hymenobacter nitidus]
MRVVLLSALFLGLLAAQASHAQSQFQVQSQFRARLWEQTQWQGYSRPQPSPSQSARQIMMQPSIPVDSDGSIKTEPDSATRHLYVRNKVRSVLKIRLDQDGNAQDTVEYQAVDRQGRWLQVGTSRTKVRRQWSYNNQGQCTGLVEYPSATRPYTVINTYNPALQRGQQEVLLANGTRTIVSEKQLYRSADTVLTEIRGQALTVSQYVYPQYYQRSLRLVPHPDTVLSITCFYNGNQRPTSSQAHYLIHRRGALVESGNLTLPATAKARPTRHSVDIPAFPNPEQALATLRQGEALHPQRRHDYDQKNRLVRQEITTPVEVGAQRHLIRNVVHYTYNSLGQLIGRQGSLRAGSAPAQAAYSVFSYLPSGLLKGETTDARSAKPVFYQYQYEYYE